MCPTSKRPYQSAHTGPSYSVGQVKPPAYGPSSRSGREEPRAEADRGRRCRARAESAPQPHSGVGAVVRNAGGVRGQEAEPAQTMGGPAWLHGPGGGGKKARYLHHQSESQGQRTQNQPLMSRVVPTAIGCASEHEAWSCASCATPGSSTAGMQPSRVAIAGLFSRTTHGFDGKTRKVAVKSSEDDIPSEHCQAGADHHDEG